MRRVIPLIARQLVAILFISTGVHAATPDPTCDKDIADTDLSCAVLLYVDVNAVQQFSHPFGLPVGDQSASLETDLRVGLHKGNETKLFPGDYDECLPPKKHHIGGWYVFTDFNTDVDYQGNAYSPSLGDFHPGEDWNGAGGGNSDKCQPVYPIAPGLVVATGWTHFFGNTVFIVHRVDDSSTGVARLFVSVYGHLQTIDVVPGEYVFRSNVVGRIGTTPNDVAHLHLEVRRGEDFLIDQVTNGVRTLRLRNTSSFNGNTWPGSVDRRALHPKGDGGHSFITSHYCNPSAFAKYHRCVALSGLPAESNLPPRYLAFEGGDPGGPGDGVVVHADYYSLLQPFSIAGAETRGFTLTAFGPDIIDVDQVDPGVSIGPRAAPCDGSFSATTAQKTAVSIDGELGIATWFDPWFVNGWLDYFCGLGLDDLFVEQIFFSPFENTTLDAATIELGLPRDTCGNGICDYFYSYVPPTNEFRVYLDDSVTCPTDCFCGNGVCEVLRGETPLTCSQDCPVGVGEN